jgi:hypothetical protein
MLITMANEQGDSVWAAISAEMPPTSFLAAPA